MTDTSPLSNNCVSSDSSFYIGFADDLNRKDWLFLFLSRYHFYLGKRILRELSRSLNSDSKFLSSIQSVEFDYYELMKPYFGRDPKHLDDGEYEAIGIAHYLFMKECLKYLIIDEDKIRNFVNKHFPYLTNKLVGSIGFIRDSSTKDKTINISCAIDILTATKNKIKAGKRVFGVDKNTYEIVVAPILEKLMVSRNNE